MKRTRRKYQQVSLVAVRQTRQVFLNWARRCRKSTTLGDIAFDEISKEAGRTVIAASASLLLGRELVGMTLSSAEHAMIVAREAEAMREVFEAGAANEGLDLKVADTAKDKVLNGLTAEDFADLYKSSRMELRLYFDKTKYSRELIIAPNPATARSWRATVVRDEAGYTSTALETELRVATDPMMRDTPDLKIIYASNLPTDDRHPAFEDTMPREITASSEEEQFPANPSGHLYIGQTGKLVHRVALKDAYAAGHQLFDDHGQAMTYEQARQFPQIKSGWDVSYALNHKAGGSAAIDIMALLTSQRRGAGQCAFVYVESDAEWQYALGLLRGLLKGGDVGLGFDVASTTGETSNPSSITVTERSGLERAQRLVAAFKSKRRAVMSSRLQDVVRVVRERPTGGPGKRLCIDASNERLAAEETSEDLSPMIPVELVINSVSIQPPGYQEKINYKTYLGDLYSTAVNDNRYALPPDEYIKLDHRLPTKDGGRYFCTPEPDGKHGDTFDSGKLAEYALMDHGTLWSALV
jgi:hypothetical protein